MSRIVLFLSVVLLFLFEFPISTADLDNAGDCKFKNKENEEVKKALALLKPLIGKSFRSDAGDGYIYTVGICKDLDVPSAEGTPGAAVQIDKNDENKNANVIGGLDDTSLLSGRDWVLVEYRGGDTYGNHCKGENRRTLFMITCDPSADDNDPKMNYLAEENSKETNCYYLFEMKHSAVCPLAGRSGLSVGSILLIVFFSVAAVYLLVGFLYTRFVLGAKGKEQIPNYEFWQDFGNLQADGCDLVCRSGIKRQRNADFGGIGDDQLEPSDELRDDNLLPM